MSNDEDRPAAITLTTRDVAALDALRDALLAIRATLADAEATRPDPPRALLTPRPGETLERAIRNHVWSDER